ncbi:MAG: hypothetical protein ACLFTW_10555 [Chitinispirillaceae bacterium]
MQLKRNSVYLIPLLAIIISSPACLLTTQSYNHGKLLNPGEGLVTYGWGKKNVRIRDKIYESSYDPYEPEEYRHDTIPVTFWSHALDYRLGFLSRHPFGKGLEIGLQLEWATNSSHYTYFERVPSLEFSTRLGFADFQIFKGLYHHNMEMGWIVGSWVDNGWFAGYAAGIEYGRLIPYLNVRAGITSTDTDIARAFDDSTFFSTHKGFWYSRSTVGVSIKINRMLFFPDYITPEISFIAPDFSLAKPVGITWHIGFRWLNGI